MFLRSPIAIHLHDEISCNTGPAERFSKWGGGGTVAERAKIFFLGGGAQSLRGSVATEGQGRRSIFRIGGGGICNIKLCARSAPKN